MEKRGSAHIEIILAFILFISAVLFVTYFLISEKNAETSSAVLDKLKNRIIENLSTDIKVYSVLADDSLINQVFAVEISAEESEKARVANLSGKIVQGTMDSGKVYIKGDNSEKAFQIVIGVDIEQGMLPTERPVLDADKYKISPPLRYSLMSQKKAEELNNAYQLDYNSLKKRISQGKDFSFEIYLDGKTEFNATRNIPEGLPIFRAEESGEFLMKDGRRIFGKLTVATW